MRAALSRSGRVLLEQSDGTGTDAKRANSLSRSRRVPRRPHARTEPAPPLLVHQADTVRRPVGAPPAPARKGRVICS